MPDIHDLSGGMFGSNFLDLSSGDTPAPVPAPTVSQQPTGGDFKVGDTATITASFNGTATTKQWQTASSASGPWTDISGEKNNSLTISTAAAADAWYRLAGTNAGGTTYTNAVRVRVFALPVFSVQPNPDVLYQLAGKVESAGAAATPTTAWQWQKKSAGGTWADLPSQTNPTLTIASGTAADEGTYRLMAVNGPASTASEEVTTYNVYLLLKNDINGQSTPTKNDNQHYTWATNVGGRYIGAYYYTQKDDQPFNYPKTSSGRSAATWSSSNNNVAPITGTGAPGSGNVTAAGQYNPTLKQGQATVVATFRNLRSEMALTVLQPVTGLTIPEGNQTMAPGATKKLTVTVTPSNADDKAVNWSTSAAAVATVAADGTVTVLATATSGQTATITATAHDGSGRTATVTITVQ